MKRLDEIIGDENGREGPENQGEIIECNLRTCCWVSPQMQVQ
jgi:hypothetical protein